MREGVLNRCRSGIELVLNSKVEAIAAAGVTVVNSITGERECIPYGACVWATGVAMHPLIKQVWRTSTSCAFSQSRCARFMYCQERRNTMFATNASQL